MSAVAVASSAVLSSSPIAVLSPTRAVLVDAVGSFFVLVDTRPVSARPVATFSAPAALQFSIRVDAENRATLVVLQPREVVVVAVAGDAFAPVAQLPIRASGVENGFSSPFLRERDGVVVVVAALRGGSGFRVDAFSTAAGASASFEGPGAPRALTIDADRRVHVATDAGGFELEFRPHRRRAEIVVVRIVTPETTCETCETKCETGKMRETGEAGEEAETGETGEAGETVSESPFTSSSAPFSSFASSSVADAVSPVAPAATVFQRLRALFGVPRLRTLK